MKKLIKINTAHNVKIEYVAATLSERIIAFLLDQIVIWISILIISGVLVLFIRGPFNMVFMVVMFPILLFYTLVSELLNNGMTLGKSLLKIRVVKQDATQFSFYDHVTRWVFRLVDIWASLGTIASISIMSSPNSQRIGDFLSDTVVIKVSTSNRVSLSNIKNLNNLERHVPTYPSVVRLTEEDLLTIKETAKRYIRYKNEGHQKALDVLLVRIEEMLDIKPSGDPIKFIDTLIKDYVSLTR